MGFLMTWLLSILDRDFSRLCIDSLATIAHFFCNHRQSPGMVILEVLENIRIENVIVGK